VSELLFHPVFLGRIAYSVAFELQKQLVEERRYDRIDDVLLLLEHPPTITHSYTGRGANHLLAAPSVLADRGVTVQPTDRGGDITFHGPGQLVGYPILQLRKDRGEQDLHRYLRQLEEVLIELSSSYGLETARVDGRTGTWIPDGSRKLAAIGVKASRWVTLHGFAINVSTDLSFFELIVPCGISGAGVTSLAAELGDGAPPLSQVVTDAADRLGRVFSRAPSPPGESLRILLDRMAPGWRYIGR
jgi:lipoyl(octanoyl) transferase